MRERAAGRVFLSPYFSAQYMNGQYTASVLYVLGNNVSFEKNE